MSSSVGNCASWGKASTACRVEVGEVRLARSLCTKLRAIDTHQKDNLHCG